MVSVFFYTAFNPQCTIMGRFHPNQNYFLKFVEGLST